MKKFWKATLIPGLCCILAGAVLAVILALGFSEELMEHQGELYINGENFLDYFEVDEFMSSTRDGVHYSKSDTRASYYFEVPEDALVTKLDFAFAVGKVEVRIGDVMAVSVEDMFENAITSEMRNGIWYIEDSLIDSGSVHSEYSPEIVITIPKDTEFEQVELYLAAGVLEADELAAKKVILEVDAGSLKIFKLAAGEALKLTNGVGEIRIYDGNLANVTVDNGIGAIAITGAVTGHNDIKCGIGEVKLSLTDRNSVNFNYSVECGIGDVEIGDMKFSGSAESSVYGRTDADYFALDCGIGHIEIKVTGN